jgi:hypothetical protein
MATPQPTYDDILRLFQETALQSKETDRKFQEIALQSKETDRKFQETDRKFQETDRKFQETAREIQEIALQSKETDRRMQDTDRQIKELGKQIGGLGAKFGSFTEGLALPSMETILRQRFGMEVISPSVRVSKAGQHMELDVLAYANGAVNQAYIVEVKSHAREASIAQLKTQLQRFREFFPEHKDKTLFGILAAVDMSESLRQQALQEGLYVARIQDEVFELTVPATFQPVAF